MKSVTYEMPSPATRLFGHKFLRLFRPFAEEELLHLLDQKGPSLWLYGGKPIFIDQRGLMSDPLRPRFLRYRVVDAFAQLPGVRQVVEAFGLTLQQNAMYAACHGTNLTLSALP